ncbi:hypothetical protein SAMN05192540_1549 [Maribacter dokdonensis]|uniref:Uncharacterized protein n=1 Tax=Maribacter dokdonensis TaxID=320912 RepID=A0A1H4M993_9FLAO|nr:hypothetical protein [Maribacter dokdonensis]SEB78942.1 hypothetical protein SAMN05192540_1549 [Maribacter dokdonensis]
MITLKGEGAYFITITGRNLEVFNFLGDKIMPVQKHRQRIVNYDLILMNNGENK